jgi:cytochrome b561
MPDQTTKSTRIMQWLLYAFVLITLVAGILSFVVNGKDKSKNKINHPTTKQEQMF